MGLLGVYATDPNLTSQLPHFQYQTRENFSSQSFKKKVDLTFFFTSLNFSKKKKAASTNFNFVLLDTRNGLDRRIGRR